MINQTATKLFIVSDRYSHDRLEVESVEAFHALVAECGWEPAEITERMDGNWYDANGMVLELANA